MASLLPFSYCFGKSEAVNSGEEPEGEARIARSRCSQHFQHTWNEQMHFALPRQVSRAPVQPVVMMCSSPSADEDRHLHFAGEMHVDSEVFSSFCWR